MKSKINKQLAASKLNAHTLIHSDITRIQKKNKIKKNTTITAV